MIRIRTYEVNYIGGEHFCKLATFTSRELAEKYVNDLKKSNHIYSIHESYLYHSLPY